MALSLVACTSIVDFDRVVAIDVVGPSEPTLEEGDTLRMAAYGVSAAGDSVPNAEVFWQAVVTDTGPAVVSIDSGGLMAGLRAGTGSIQALHQSLATPLISVLVTPRADTIVTDSARITHMAGDTTTLRVSVIAFPDTGTAPVPIVGNPVHFRLVEPVGGNDVRLLATDGNPGATADSILVDTDAAGRAAVVVRPVSGGTLPDSAIVHAVALTATGAFVPGSPLGFVIIFP